MSLIGNRYVARLNTRRKKMRSQEAWILTLRPKIVPTFHPLPSIPAMALPPAGPPVQAGLIICFSVVIHMQKKSSLAAHYI
jgi:hypothetical protein